MSTLNLMFIVVSCIKTLQKAHQIRSFKVICRGILVYNELISTQYTWDLINMHVIFSNSLYSLPMFGVFNFSKTTWKWHAKFNVTDCHCQAYNLLVSIVAFGSNSLDFLEFFISMFAVFGIFLFSRLRQTNASSGNDRLHLPIHFFSCVYFYCKYMFAVFFIVGTFFSLAPFK